MFYRVGIIFNGPSNGHEILSPRLEYDAARTEFRAVRKQKQDAAEVLRSWASLPSKSILAVHITEEEEAS